MKRALITGITGQDGSYLAELLLGKGYEVHGIVRRSATPNTKNIDEIKDRLHLHYGDLTDSGSITQIVNEVVPDEIYNLGAQSHVHVSFQCPDYTANVVGLGALRVLEAARMCQERHGKQVKVYSAGSSEQFGSAPPPQTMDTPFHPRSPYAVAKLYAYWQTINYREAYNMFACNGILYNHESIRRSEEFVTRKVTKAAARIALGRQKVLRLGNLDARRDWGHSPDFVTAMWMMLQHDVPGDYIVATGEAHSVRELCDVAFKRVGLDYRDYVISDPELFRPAEVNYLLGDASKTTEMLGWKPTKTFVDLIHEMVDYDYLMEEGPERYPDPEYN